MDLFRSMKDGFQLLLNFIVKVLKVLGIKNYDDIFEDDAAEETPADDTPAEG
ncbi:MAG: hypothetical protein IJ766_04750 [Clostridia bacterium]|nr:hypothetical protein [Clostridia bacterium]